VNCLLCRWRSWPSGLLDLLVPSSPWAKRSAAGAISSIPGLGLPTHLPWKTLDSGPSIGRRRSIDEASFHPNLPLPSRFWNLVFLALCLIFSDWVSAAKISLPEWCPHCTYSESPTASGVFLISRDYGLESALPVLEFPLL